MLVEGSRKTALASQPSASAVRNNSHVVRHSERVAMTAGFPILSFTAEFDFI